MTAPALFIGHGSPENAVLDNAFSRSLRLLGERLPRPRAALVVSAHWLSRGLFASSAAQPEQIFDFSGFPEALYRVRYTPATSPELLADMAELALPWQPAPQRGFDHGVWTVLKHLWPDADVPLVQLSLDIGRDRRGQLAVGTTLKGLREKGYMLVGSGNVVHNLRALDWQARDDGFDWAKRFDLAVKEAIERDDRDSLVTPSPELAADARLSVPTEEHYWPLLTVVGARRPEDRVEWVYEGYEYGGISLRSLLLS